MTNIFQQLCDLLDAQIPCVLAIVLETKGSTPQKAGAKAIFTGDGRILGTLGGGCLEAESRQRSLGALRNGERQIFRLILDDDFGWDDGLICGGSVEIFLDPHPAVNRRVWDALGQPATKAQWLRIALDSGLARIETGEAASRPRRVTKVDQEYIEPVFPKDPLFIAGAGHIGTALCKLCAALDFDVTVIDDRFEFANRERLPDAARILAEDPAGALARLPVGGESYIVIVTRGHRNDALVLREVMGKPVAYLGMIGSQRKVRMIFQEFLDQGLATEAQLKRVRSPMGIPIGSETVNEIALSIAAELVQVRAQRRENNGC